MADLPLIDLAVYSRMTWNSNLDSLPLQGDDNGGDTEEWEDELPGEEQEDDE